MGWPPPTGLAALDGDGETVGRPDGTWVMVGEGVAVATKGDGMPDPGTEDGADPMQPERRIPSVTTRPARRRALRPP